MTADRSLTPADVAVALRSFPRRFRGVVARPDDAEERFDPDEVARRFGPDGTSAAEHLLAADGVLALLDGALQEARRGDEVMLHPAFDDLGSASWDDDHTPVPALLDQLEATATRTADRVESVETERWATTARIADRSTGVPLLTVAQDAVGAVADHLRAAQKVIDAVV